MLRIDVLAWPAVLAVAIGMAACGSGSAADRAAITGALNRAFVTFDAAACHEVFTANALEQINFEPDETPIASCEDDVDPEDNARSIAVTSLSVGDGTASAVVVPKGGNVQGVALSLDLVDADGWRIDRLGTMRVRDHVRLVAGMMRSFDRGNVTKAEWGCMRTQLMRTSDRAYSRIYVDHRNEFVFEIARECLGDGTNAGTLEALLRRQLTDEAGLTSDEARCMIAAIREQLVRFDLEDGGQVFSDPFVAAALRRAAPACLGPDGPSGTVPDPS